MEMHVFDGTALGSLTEGEAEERNKAGTGNMVLRKGMHMVLGLLSGKWCPQITGMDEDNLVSPPRHGIQRHCSWEIVTGCFLPNYAT